MCCDLLAISSVCCDRSSDVIFIIRFVISAWTHAGQRAFESWLDVPRYGLGTTSGKTIKPEADLCRFTLALSKLVPEKPWDWRLCRSRFQISGGAWPRSNPREQNLGSAPESVTGLTFPLLKTFWRLVGSVTRLCLFSYRLGHHHRQRHHITLRFHAEYPSCRGLTGVFFFRPNGSCWKKQTWTKTVAYLFMSLRKL